MMLELILDLIYPPRCIVCNDIFEFGTRKFLCDECKNLIAPINSKRCEKCSRPIEFGNLCSICARNHEKIFFDKNFSIFIYDDVISDLIHRFKFKNHPAIGKALSTIIANEINFAIPQKIDCIIPVPIHRIRKRERGFNQSEILAKKLAQKLQISLRTDLLKRIRNTKPQWALDYHERKRNLIDAFSCKNVSGKNIILFDDIFTTGTTINECSKVLKSAGANYILSLTLAITSKKL